MTRPFHIVAGLALLFVLILSGCRKDEKSTWQPEYLVPIATADLSLQNVVEDSLFSEGDEGLLSLVYRNTIYDFSLSDQVIEVPDTTLIKSFNLESIRIGQQTVEQAVTILQIIDALKSAGNPLGFLLELAVNSGNAIQVDAFAITDAFSESFDASAFFDHAILASGNLEITIENNFPVEIDTLAFEIRNSVSQTLVLSDTFYNIPPGGLAYEVYDMTGKEVEGTLEMKVIHLSSPGSSPNTVVFQDTDHLLVTLFTSGMTAQEATAVFPSQEVFEVAEEISFDLDDKEFTYLEIQSGQLIVDLTSSVEEALTLNYMLQGAYDDNGNPFLIQVNVPPAPVGGTSTASGTFDLSNYAVNLTGQDGTKFNTYTQVITGVVDSSGIARTLRSTDSIQMNVTFSTITPKYVKGYLGQETFIVGPEKTKVEYLDEIKSGTLHFEDVNLDFVLSNSLGVSGEVLVKSFSTENGGSNASLSGALIGSNIEVDRAMDFPLRPYTTEVSVNNGNSNATDLINIFPDYASYELEIEINPDGNQLDYQDFVYFDSRLSVYLDAEIPLSVKANTLTLCDTIDFSISDASGDLDRIQSGVLHLITYNGYPLDANIRMVLYDDISSSPLDTLIAAHRVEEGKMNASCRVDEITRTQLDIPVDGDRLEELKKATKAAVYVDFSTVASEPACAGDFIKIYSDYTFELKLTANFVYELSSSF